MKMQNVTVVFYYDELCFIMAEDPTDSKCAELYSVSNNPRFRRDAEAFRRPDGTVNFYDLPRDRFEVKKADLEVGEDGAFKIVRLRDWE